jgi:hypothetical protein
MQCIDTVMDDNMISMIATSDIDVIRACFDRRASGGPVFTIVCNLKLVLEGRRTDRCELNKIQERFAARRTSTIGDSVFLSFLHPSNTVWIVNQDPSSQQLHQMSGIKYKREKQHQLNNVCQYQIRLQVCRRVRSEAKGKQGKRREIFWRIHGRTEERGQRHRVG